MTATFDRPVMTIADLASAPLPDDATIPERRLKALSMRNVGRTYEQIAQAMRDRYPGYDAKAAQRDVKAAIKEVVKIPTDQMVDRQRAILLELTWSNLPLAKTGDKDAASTVLGCLAHEAKLYGLYAPARVNVGISETEFGAQASALLRTIGPGPLRELAGLPSVEPSPGVANEPIDAQVIDADVIPDEQWSNIGGPDPD